MKSLNFRRLRSDYQYGVDFVEIILLVVKLLFKKSQPNNKSHRNLVNRVLLNVHTDLHYSFFLFVYKASAVK